MSSVVIMGKKLPEAERNGIVSVLTSESESDSIVETAWEAAENTVMGGMAEGAETGVGTGVGVAAGGLPIWVRKEGS